LVRVLVLAIQRTSTTHHDENGDRGVPPVFVVTRLPELLWQAECVAARAPAGAIVVGGAHGRHGTVAAASPVARRHGVVIGQPMAVARARCPGATVLAGHLARQMEVASAVHTTIAAALPETIWLHAAHGVATIAHRSAAGVLATVDRIRREIDDDLGVSVAAGVAGSRLGADVAARLVGSAGLLHILPGYESRLLAPLGLRWLDGIDRDLLERCHAHRLYTIGALGNASPAVLRDLAGGAGLVLGRLARGEDPRILPPFVPPTRLTKFVRATMAADSPGLQASTCAERALHAADELLSQVDRTRSVREVRLRYWDDDVPERLSVLRPTSSRPWTDVSAVLEALFARLPADLPPTAAGLLTLLLVPGESAPASPRHCVVPPEVGGSRAPGRRSA
jgi:nucleotidyltransferase/DNA polymerase involved in DNA repair